MAYPAKFHILRGKNTAKVKIYDENTVKITR